MTDMDLLDARNLVSLPDLCAACGVEPDWVEDLVAHGVVSPISGETSFSALAILRLSKARRLERDFSLNTPGLALALDLLDEIDRLRARLARAGLL
jgi:chaperone modulatory protein CbpM